MFCFNLDHQIYPVVLISPVMEEGTVFRVDLNHLTLLVLEKENSVNLDRQRYSLSLLFIMLFNILDQQKYPVIPPITS